MQLANLTEKAQQASWSYSGNAAESGGDARCMGSRMTNRMYDISRHIQLNCGLSAAEGRYVPEITCFSGMQRLKGWAKLAASCQPRMRPLPSTHSA